MKKIVWTFGIIAGVICGGMFYLDIPEPGESMNFEDGHLWGYLSMIIALSSIFFAVWQYRRTEGGGAVNFKKSFLIGLYITLIASGIYMVGWEIYYNLYASDFPAQYVEFQRSQLEEQGKTAEEIENILAPQRENMALYADNVLFRLAMTFLEIFPVGLLISLVVAVIFGVVLRRKSVAAS